MGNEERLPDKKHQECLDCKAIWYTWKEEWCPYCNSQNIKLFNDKT